MTKLQEQVGEISVFYSVYRTSIAATKGTTEKPEACGALGKTIRQSQEPNQLGYCNSTPPLTAKTQRKGKWVNMHTNAIYPDFYYLKMPNIQFRIKQKSIQEILQSLLRANSIKSKRHK